VDGRIRADDIRLRALQRAEPATQPGQAAPPVREPPGSEALEDRLDGLQRDAIVQALEQTRYNKTAAARLLGVTFRALRYRIKKLGIE
jgi:two-component system response regulator PilR (NtrC family)